MLETINAMNNDFQPNPARIEPATSGMIHNLPSFKLKEAPKNPDQCSCNVCMEDYVAGERVRAMPCLHIFHRKCIDQWLMKNKLCPMCKTPCDAAEFNE